MADLDDGEADVQITRLQKLQQYHDTVQTIINADWSKEPSPNEALNEEVALQRSGEIVRIINLRGELSTQSNTA